MILSVNEPIRALDKHLRDGRHLTIDLVPGEDPNSGTYWMTATLDGIVTDARFIAKVRRNSSTVPGLPHAIEVKFTEPHPTIANLPIWVRRPVGLTEAEADQIEAAQREWFERPKRLAAAVEAPTQVRRMPAPFPAGHVMWWDGEPMMSLGVVGRTEIEEDGRSVGLDAEEGTLFDVKVRALTVAEQQMLAKTTVTERK
jgi:hypothetical protein